MNIGIRHHVHFQNDGETAPVWMKAASALVAHVNELYGDAPEIWCESVHVDGMHTLEITFPVDEPSPVEATIIFVHVGRTREQIRRLRDRPLEPFDVDANDETKEIDIHVDVLDDGEALCFLTQLAIQSHAKLRLDLALNVQAETIQ